MNFEDKIFEYMECHSNVTTMHELNTVFPEYTYGYLKHCISMLKFSFRIKAMYIKDEYKYIIIE